MVPLKFYLKPQYHTYGLLFFALLNSVIAAPGCRPRRPSNVAQLPPPSERTAVGPGDVVSLEIVGEKELPKEYQVASDGTVELPYVQTLKVAGLEPPEISRLVRDRLIERGVLRDPSVIVQVKEYHSRRITLLGQVVRPGSFPLSPGLSLIQAISLAGGLTAIADSDRVNITRKTKGKMVTVVLSVGAITEGQAADIPLQAGDQIFVHDRIF